MGTRASTDTTNKWSFKDRLLVRLLFARVTWSGLGWASVRVIEDWLTLYIGALVGAAIALASSGQYVLSSRRNDCLLIYLLIGIAILPVSSVATAIRAACEEMESDGRE